jgi:hypothetical protein
LSKIGSSVAEKNGAEWVIAGFAAPAVTVASEPSAQSAEKPAPGLGIRLAQPGSSIARRNLRFSRSTTLTDDAG